jgi:glyoxylase-like metal-dependent hydrolase (beta-lactamase superfamily II)
VSFVAASLVSRSIDPGDLRYLLVPDYEHSMNIVAFAQAYPTAKCIGPEGIDSKQPSITWAGILGAGGETKTYGFEDEIKLHYFPGHMNKEIAVLHVPSKTLLCADLVFNLPPTEGYKQTSQSGEAVWPVNKLQESLQPGTAAHSVVGTLTGKDKE